MKNDNNKENTMKTTKTLFTVLFKKMPTFGTINAKDYDPTIYSEKVRTTSADNARKLVLAKYAPKKVRGARVFSKRLGTFKETTVTVASPINIIKVTPPVVETFISFAGTRKYVEKKVRVIASARRPRFMR
jgi:hypothetical protein